MGRPPLNLLPMETLLLNKADYKDYADQAESLEMDRLRPHILGAQRNRLRPVLTDKLFTELLRLVEVERAAADTATPAPLVDAWQELRKQSIAVVACASMARYSPFSQTTATSNSMVRKTSQYSEPIDPRDLARQATIYDGDALSYEASLRDWLKVNGALFGEFYPPATCCGATEVSRTPIMVVQAIRRPDDVRPSRPHFVEPYTAPAIPVPLPVPVAPTASALDQDTLTGRIQFPAGTTLDQVEVNVTM
jgi:hypothetical protein